MELNEYYNTIAEKYHAGAQRLPDAVLVSFLSYVPASGSVLDAGCGPGNETEYFRTHGFRATGIDASEDMIRIARHEYPSGQYEVADIRGYLPEHSFDGVWCSAVLMHFDTPTRKEIIHSCILPAATSVAGFVVPFGAEEEQHGKSILFHHFTEPQLQEELANPDWDIALIKKIELKSPWLMAICVRRSI